MLFVNLTLDKDNDSDSSAANHSSDSQVNADAGQFAVLEIVLIGTLFGFVSIFTAVSNLFVIIAVKTNKQLQTITNYFLLSLAIADATIGFISMPLFSVKMIMQKWPFGAFICDNWLAIDYTMSNASVANLMIITCDRYLSVTRPLTYRAKRTSKRVAMMIMTAWIISIALWTPWIYAWPYIEGTRSVPETECFVQFLTTNVYITLSTAAAAFYLPVVIMCMLYWRVYAITKQRTRELNHLCAGKSAYGRFRQTGPRPSAPSQLTTPNGIAPRINKTCLICTKTLFCRWRICVAHSDVNAANADPDADADANADADADADADAETQTYRGQHMRAHCTAYMLQESFLRRSVAAKSDRHPVGQIPSSESASSHLSVTSGNCQNRRKASSHAQGVAPPPPPPPPQLQLTPPPPPPLQQQVLQKRQRNSESKAAKTISAILAAFIITWTPYNLFTVIEAFYPKSISATVYDLGYYLCYLNSSINPIVYCLTNNNFKQSFIRILKCSFRSPAQSTKAKQSLPHSTAARPLANRKHVPSSISTTSFDDSRRKRTSDYLYRKHMSMQPGMATPEVSQNGTIYEEEQPNRAQSCFEIPISVESMSANSVGAKCPEKELLSRYVANRSFRMQFPIPRHIRSESIDEQEDELEMSEDAPEYV